MSDIIQLEKTDARYPKLLLEIPGPPSVLYVRSQQDIQSLDDWGPMVSVVGTRRMTSYGKEMTMRIVRGLAYAGITIVSGMAYGIDTIAHETTLGANGKTIAVLGCGADVIYPAGNSMLYRKILKDGAILSEYPPGTKATKYSFPTRNRIVSGLSLATVVIEGAEDSGTLITARCAAEQGREVCAVPGPVTSIFSAAPLRLLREGATLVRSADDVLEAIGYEIAGMKKQRVQLTTDPTEQRILALLSAESLHVDAIAKQSGLSAQLISETLSILEIHGLVRKEINGRYCLINA